MIEKISVIGLGKLGASMAAGMASRGFDVIGVDVNQSTVDALNSGVAPVQEPQLPETIGANKQRLRATTSHEKAVLESDVSFVAVPTPSDDRGAFSLQYAAYAFRELGRALKKKQSYHVIVLTVRCYQARLATGCYQFLKRSLVRNAGLISVYVITPNLSPLVVLSEIF